jgi:hypothetical protein
MTTKWVDIVLSDDAPNETWRELFAGAKDCALEAGSPDRLHSELSIPDRLLADSAWDLWVNYSTTAPRTSIMLKEWYDRMSSTGKAILILDALSLRELSVLVKTAMARNITPVEVSVTGSEVPSDTDSFAKSLGVTSRSALTNNSAPKGFVFHSDSMFTDVVGIPFEDAINGVEHTPYVFIWHTFIDDMLHQLGKNPEQVYKQVAQRLSADGFWAYVDRLRQGRELVITGDHGYATSKSFVGEETDTDIVDALRGTFGASRYKVQSSPWNHRFMPPLVVSENGHHVVIGQRKWKVPSGFPSLTHGGLSLLEVAVPFIRLPAI